MCLPLRGMGPMIAEGEMPILRRSWCFHRMACESGMGGHWAAHREVFHGF